MYIILMQFLASPVSMNATSLSSLSASTIPIDCPQHDDKNKEKKSKDKDNNSKDEKKEPCVKTDKVEPVIKDRTGDESKSEKTEREQKGLTTSSSGK